MEDTNVDDNKSISSFQNIQKILELENNKDAFDFSPNNFFYTNLNSLVHYGESKFTTDDQIIKTLRLYKKAFEQNVDVFEESILNSDFIATLINILLKTKDILTAHGDSKAYLNGKLQFTFIQQHIFDILISLSKCSNLIILMILDDNKLFDNLISLIPTIQYSGQAKSFLCLFHSYFEKFPDISYSYCIPNNFISDISELSSKNQFFNSTTTYNYILMLFEDLLKYVELSELDIDYMMTATLAMLFDFQKYDWCASACSLLMLFFEKRRDTIDVFTDDLMIPGFFFNVMKNLSEKKNFLIICDICSVINKCLDCTSDEQMKLDIIKIYELDVIYSILKRVDSKTINVSPIINLISKHFEIQKIPLDYFVSSGGYDIIIEFLNGSTFLAYISILKLLCQMSEIFGWTSMPENSFRLFLEHCFDILTIEDLETVKIFCTGLNCALIVNDPDFRQYVLTVYHEVVGNDEILRNLEVDGPDEIRSLVGEILRIIDFEDAQRQ